jgi:hypothetical protein
MNSVVLVIGVTFWFLYRYGGQNSNNGRGQNQQSNSTFGHVLSWVWKIAGVFLFFMVIRNLKEVYDFFVFQGDQWWPIVKENANRLLSDFRYFIQKIMKGD